MKRFSADSRVAFVTSAGIGSQKQALDQNILEVVRLVKVKKIVQGLVLHVVALPPNLRRWDMSKSVP